MASLVAAAWLLVLLSLPCWHAWTRIDVAMFVVTARRNITGHWIIQADLDHSMRLDADELESYGLYARVDVTSSRHKEVFDLIVDVKVPDKELILLRSAKENYCRLIPSTGNRYCMQSHMTTWEKSRESCRRTRTDLAVPTNEEELSTIVRLSGIAVYWTGLKMDGDKITDAYGSDAGDVPVSLSYHGRCFVVYADLCNFPCEGNLSGICQRSLLP